VQGDPAWRCRQWNTDASRELAASDAIGTPASIDDWPSIEQRVTEYGQQKAIRYGDNTKADLTVVPTLDLMQGKEVVA